MTLKIVNNVPAINAHRNLLASDRAINKHLEKISSGLEITRASDGPADLIISEQLRSQIAGLKQAVRNSESSISMVQTTEAAMEELNILLTQLRKLAVHASNDAANDKLMLQADQDEVDYIIDTINRIAEQTSFGTKHLLDGSNASRGVAIGPGLEFVSASINTKDSGPSGYDISVIDPATKATVISEDFTEDDFAQDIFVPGEEKEITVAQGGRSTTLTIGVGTTLDILIGRLNSAFQDSNLDLNALKNPQDQDQLVIESNQYGDGHVFSVSSTVEGLFGEPYEIVEAIDGTNIYGTIDKTNIINGKEVVEKYATQGKGNIMTGVFGTPVHDLAARYTDVGEYLDPDTPVGKIVVAQNALTFQVGADYGQYLKYSLSSTYAKDLANGIENMSGYESIADIDLRTFQGAQDALKLVVEAANYVSSTRAKLGALQKNALEPTVDYTRTLVENMTFSESSIRDADMAEKTADLVRSQIKAQASAAAQIHASNSPKITQSLLAAVTP